jgi:hypothetical protein
VVNVTLRNALTASSLDIPQDKEEKNISPSTAKKRKEDTKNQRFFQRDSAYT